MQKNFLTKFAIFLLALTMISVSLVSGTYAKYVSTATYSDTAIVAKWLVSAGAASGSWDIFDASHIFDTYNVSDYTAAGTDDTDVKNATSGDGIIAPGTWGKFTYTIKNDSDVTAQYTVDYTVDNDGVPLQWSTDGSTWTTTLADVASPVDIAIGGSANVTLWWRWGYDSAAGNTVAGQTDSGDTTLGEAGTAAPSISIAATFTQKD